MTRHTTLPPVKRGDTWEFEFSWKNQDTPIDLSNCTARMQIRDRRTGALIAEASSANNNIVINGPTGSVMVKFTPTDTENANPGIYESDLEITYPVSGRVQSSGTIQIVIEEDITR